MEKETKYDEFMTVGEMEKYLHISRALAYQIIHKPNFPIIRIGKRIIINREKLISWLEENNGHIEVG